MAIHKGKEPVYDIVDEFKELCLANDQSLLWPGQETWTLKNLNSLKVAFIDNPDEGSSNFLEKWKTQLNDESEDVHRIATEILGFYHLFHSTGRAEIKMGQLQQIVSWKLSHDSPDLSVFQKAFDVSGIGNPGTYYVTARYDVIAYFLKTFIEIKENRIDIKNELAVKATADSVSFKHPRNATGSRNVLMHLLFPDKYERSASGDHRELIRTRYENIAVLPDDLDEALFIIRQELAKKYGTGFDFYDENIQSQWSDQYVGDEDTSVPTEKIERASHREPNYWVEMANTNDAENLGDGRIKKVDSSGRIIYETGKLLFSPARDMSNRDRFRFMRDCQQGDIVFHLISPDKFIGVSKVKQSFKELPDIKFRGYNAPSYTVDLTDYQPLTPFFTREQFFSEPCKTELLEIRENHSNLFYHKNNGPTGIRLYQGGYLTKLPKQAVSSLEKMYRLVNGPNSHFNHFENLDDTVEPNRLGPTIEELSAYCHTDLSDLNKLIHLLEQKKQIILEGPPGSGKTFLADALGRYLTGNNFDDIPNEQFEIVQFHQSYGYEDLVHGIRPETDGSGQLRYELRDGVFKRLCQLAEISDKKFVIVVDEINRGNLSRIFGELMLLLEYRDKEVSLTYSTDTDNKFRIPENIYLIGTMNTTDRSLAQIDYALRRRFYFYRLMPLVGEDAPVLRKWLESQDITPDRRDSLIELFTNLNTKLQQELGEHFQVGQSYFMNTDIAEDDHLENIWKHSIMPLLEEYFYARRDRTELLSQFSIDKLSASDT